MMLLAVIAIVIATAEFAKFNQRPAIESPAGSVMVSAAHAGIVDRIYFASGQTVREGDLLVEFKTGAIRAPFSGLLGIRLVNPGQRVAVGDPIVALHNRIQPASSAVTADCEPEWNPVRHATKRSAGVRRRPDLRH